jgi:hypothetical protein
VPRDIDPIADKAHALTAELRAVPHEGGEPVRADDTMARNRRIVAVTQGISDGACREWPAGDDADEAV